MSYWSVFGCERSVGDFIWSPPAHTTASHGAAMLLLPAGARTRAGPQCETPRATCRFFRVSRAPPLDVGNRPGVLQHVF